MKIARLASLMLVAIMAIGLAVASAASAAGPLFLPTGAKVTGTSGESVLTAEGETVTCASDVVSGGTVTSSTLVGGLLVHFLECTGKNGSTGETCPVMSPGAPAENLILTSTLHGVLGLILPKPTSGSDVALVVLPIKQPFVTLLGKCLKLEAAVEGQVAGLVNPVNKSILKGGTVEFLAPGGVQAIKDVDLSTGGLVAPKLTAFGLIKATENTIEDVEYSSDTEVC